MAHTLIETNSFIIIILITILLTVIGIGTSIYNIITLRSIKNMENMKTAEIISITALSLYTVLGIILLLILTLNLCHSDHKPIINPDVGTARDLVQLLK